MDDRAAAGDPGSFEGRLMIPPGQERAFRDGSLAVSALGLGIGVAVLYAFHWLALRGLL
jgi:hypothetical protein